MLRIKAAYNNYILFFISMLSILVIGYIDYKTNPEISFSIFYLIPISLTSLYSKSKSFVLLTILSASIVWLYADVKTNEYSNSYIPFWNAFVRFSIFTLVGLLLFNLKEKYNKLIILNNELENINKEKNRLIGITGHDLRNPLGVIFSYSEMLISDYSTRLGPEAFEIINQIKELSKSTLDFLKKILDLSKIEAGIVETHPVPHDYIKFINTYIHFNQILANAKEIKIVLETKEKEIILNFDEQYLGEVINNLISNAIKFSHSHSEIIIRISIQEKDKVKTEVIDNGMGIPKEEQYMLFKYFQKTSTKPTGGESSTGLGLAIAKKIIDEHKGTIGVISEYEKGSNFYFELPVN